MAFTDQAGPSFRSHRHAPLEDMRGPPTYTAPPLGAQDTQFEIFQWHPQFLGCQTYFLDHAQHSDPVIALSKFLNIVLPFQKEHPVFSSQPLSPVVGSLSSGMPPHLRQPPTHFPRETTTGRSMPSISIVSYIRRLVATAFDTPEVLHGFFGDSWIEGIGPLHEVERRNYLFAAKSSSWLEVKASYDMNPQETIPFLKPLQRVTEVEIAQAEAQWSDWIAMQDWMLGPRAPGTPGTGGMQEPRIKREPRG